MRTKKTTTQHANPALIMHAHCQTFLANLDTNQALATLCKKVIREIKNTELPPGLVLDVARVADGHHDAHHNIIISDAVYQTLLEQKCHELWSFWCKALVDHLPSYQARNQLQQAIASPAELQEIIVMRRSVSRDLLPSFCQLLGHIWPTDPRPSPSAPTDTDAPTHINTGTKTAHGSKGISISAYVDVLLLRLFNANNIAGIKSSELAASLRTHVAPGEAAAITDFLVQLVRRDYLSPKKAAKMATKSQLFNDVTFLKTANDSQVDIYYNQGKTAAYFGVSAQTLIRYRKSGDLPEPYWRKQKGEIQFNINRCTGINGLKPVKPQ